MISAQDAEKKLGALRQHLAGLVSQQEELSETLNMLEEQRARAVRDLAAGDPWERTIEALDAQMRPFRLKLEGTEGLTSECQEKVRAAEEALNEACARERQEAEAEARRREVAALQAILADLPAREDRIFHLYADLCTALAEVRIAEVRARGLLDPRPFFDFMLALPVRIKDRLERENWRRLTDLGFMQYTWEIWPTLPSEVCPPGKGPVFPEDCVKSLLR